VPEYFAQSHWLKQLHFVHDITVIYDDWRRQVSPPVGLHGGRVVACYLNGQWMAHLAACPQIPLTSPYDITPASAEVLAAMAPERLRGVAVSGAMEDVYAAGVLVLQAMGIHCYKAGSNKEAHIEANARAALPSWNLDRSDVEKTLWQISHVKKCLAELGLVICRCVTFSPDARATSLQELQAALSRLLALEDAAAFAQMLDDCMRPAEALQFLEWAVAKQPAAFGEEHRIRLLAADLCNRLSKPAQELQHLERLLQIVPNRYNLEHRRMELRCDNYLMKTSHINTGADPEADWLLAELKRLRPPNPSQLDSEDRHKLKEDHMRAAMICGRVGDLYQRAQELWSITDLDWADIEALFLYGLSLRDLEAEARINQQYRGEVSETMNALLREVDRRLKRLQEAGIIVDNEVKAWTERFQSLQLH
jgi:tetratricopeptide (TPR) repeat protein